MRVSQIVPNLGSHDAIAREVMAIDRLLRGAGHAAALFAGKVHPRAAAGWRPLTEYRPGDWDAVILHHSTDSGGAELLTGTRGILLYHNITPPRYFYGINPELVAAGARGLAQLDVLLPAAAAVWADSACNLAELHARGWRGGRVVPYLLDGEAGEPGAVAAGLPDEPLLLMVGRVVPNKGHDFVLRALAKLTEKLPAARLAIVGSDAGAALWRRRLEELAAKLGVAERVTWAGECSDAELAGWYRRAALLAVASEHEGFCVPLVEAMRAGLPVLALAQPAVEETLGGSGCLVTRREPALFAAAAQRLLTDATLRAAVIAAQRRRADDFAPARTGGIMLAALADALAGRPAPDGARTESAPAVLRPAGLGGRRRKVAFIVPRFGSGFFGGAELHAARLAERMAAHWQCEVLTTCARDYTTWKNEYPAGTETCGPLTVRRFPVDRERDPAAFANRCELLFRQEHTRADEEQWMRDQGPYSSALLAYLAAQAGDYDDFIFSTYLYATTWFGLPLVRDRAWLVATAEDAPPLRLGLFRELFHMPRGIIYCTASEKELVNRLHDNRDCRSLVAGIGIDVPGEPDPARFRRKYNISGDFVLYVGRLTPDKGSDIMFAHFAKFARGRHAGLQLLLAGNRVMTVPAHPNITHLGLLDEQDKFDALAAARCLIHPSPYESLGLILLEAWQAGLPALVNGACAVLAQHCRESGGGVTFADYREFAGQLERLLADRAGAAAMGARGRAYVQAHYAWPAVERQYLDFIGN